MARPLWHYTRGLKKLDQSIGAMRSALIPEAAKPLLELTRIDDYMFAQLGFKIPKPMTLLLKLFGLSPGTISVWHDAESGFFTEARAMPGAPPVYRAVSDEVAITILKGELTHDLEDTLMTPDDYLGE